MKIEINLPEAENLASAIMLLAEQVERLNGQLARKGQPTTEANTEKPAKVKKAVKPTLYSSRDIASFLAGVVTPGHTIADAEVEAIQESDTVDQEETPTREDTREVNAQEVKLGPIPFHFDGQWDKEARLARFKCPDSELRGQTGYLCKKNYGNGCGSKTRCFGCNDMFKKSGVKPSDRLLDKLKREYLKKLKAAEGK